MDYWGAKGYWAPRPLKLLGGLAPPLAPPLPTPMIVSVSANFPTYLRAFTVPGEYLISECFRSLHGRCKPIFDSCPSGYHESLSFCDVLQSCCYPPPNTGTGSSGNGSTSSPSQTSHGMSIVKQVLRISGNRNLNFPIKSVKMKIFIYAIISLPFKFLN